jgi:hypothetical protein
MKVIFKLEKQARSGGGDKYLAEGNDKFNIYFPQAISRVDGKVRDEIVVDISEE